MRVIKLENNKIIEVKDMLEHYQLKENELVSDIGELGQRMQDDGTFVDALESQTPRPYMPTNAEIAQMISDLQADLVIEGVI